MSTVTPTYSTDDKLQWEVLKLKAETEHISKPFLKQPTTWLALVTLIISIAGNFVQYSSADRQKQIAEIRKERLELESVRLEEKRRQLDAEVTKLQAALTAAEAGQRKQDELLAKLKADISSATVTKEKLEQQVTDVRDLAAKSPEIAIISGIVQLMSQGRTSAEATKKAP